jgi:hypothetical protein
MEMRKFRGHAHIFSDVGGFGVAEVCEDLNRSLHRVIVPNVSENARRIGDHLRRAGADFDDAGWTGV